MTENIKHKKRVLVMSRNYNNLLGMARSLAGGDYDIEIVRLIQINHKVMKLVAKTYPERACKYASAYHVCICNWDADNLISFLMEIYDPDRETLIIPCDDLAIPWLDDNYERLRKYYLFSDIAKTQGEITKMMNKQHQKKAVLDFGLDSAAAHDICIRDGKYDFPSGINYPCFLKPATLIMGGKDYLKRYDEEESLKQAVSKLASKFKNADLIVEDFVDIKKEYAILGLSIGGKVLLPDGCLEFVEGGHGSRKGIMSLGEVVSSPEILTFLEKLKAFVESLNYTGMFDVDAIEGNGKILFCEINMRFGGSGYAITKCGVNFPRMFADYMFFGKEIPDECKLDGIGKQFVSEKILLEDVTEKYLSKKEAYDIINKADIHFLIDDEDPGPFKKVERSFRYTAKITMALKELYKKFR